MGDYWVDVDLQPSRLTGSDLAELLRIIERGFPGQASPRDLELHSYLPGMVAQGRSLDDYLATPGLPNVLTRLEILRVHRNGSLEVDREVELTFLPILARLRVAGSDELWVLARRKEICEFLKSKRPWYWPLAGRWAWLGLLLGGALCAAVAAGHRPVLFTLGVAAALVALEVAAVLEFQDRLMPHTKIVLGSPRQQTRREG